MKVIAKGFPDRHLWYCRTNVLSGVFDVMGKIIPATACPDSSNTLT
jgi:hypothetical protein